MKPCEETLDESWQPKEWHHPSQISLVVCQKSNYGWWLKGEKMSLVAVGGGNSEPPTYKITNWRHNNPPRCDLGAVVTVQPCPSTPMSAIAFEHISPSHYIVGQHCESDVTFCQKINENVKCMKKWMYVYRTGQWPLWGETEWKATVECRLYIVVQKLSSKIVSLQKPQALKQ